MKMTTKGRYAVTAMLDLATHAGQTPTPLADIAERQGISLSYLEQLFAKLRRYDLVRSTRGPGGGYSLNLDADQIPVGSVIRAVNETLPGNQGSARQCAVELIWNELSTEIEQYLDSISLADVLSSREVMDVADRQHRIFVERHTDVA
ncbi:MAG: Rrf2 family transcriptional regulator [Gammaproteobacteria bacterium]|nr:MAG: Rrf2 family transcriptional regulator [Gammaproteobacteria bacterium]